MKIDEAQKEQFLKTVIREDSLICYEYTGKKRKPIISLYLIAQDLAEIMGWLQSAILFGKIKNAPQPTISLLWEKIIISYGKNFTQSDDGFSKLEASAYFEEVDELIFHNEIMTARNSYVAHRGHNDFEYHTLLVSLAGTEEKCYVEISVPTLKKTGHYFDPQKMRKYLKALSKKVIIGLHFYGINWNWMFLMNCNWKPIWINYGRTY